MKITITKEAKQWLTVAQLPKAKALIAAMKEDQDLNFYAELLTSIVSGYSADREDVYSVTAEIAGNARVWNRYTDDSETLDVWLNVKFFSRFTSTFYMVGAYLSDIWESTSDNAEELRSHMYIREFPEAK